MSTKNIQIKIKNGAEWDELFPKTKVELVDGLAAELTGKVDKAAGKGLSTEDYTTAEKTKLAGIAAGANNYTHPTGSGNNHIPAGGASGDLLKYASAGTASWGKASDANISDVSLSKVIGAGTAASKNVGTAAGNIPVLDAGGKLDVGVLPAIAITDTFIVASETAMKALVAETGDVAIRTDLSKSFILKAMPASDVSNWEELLTPASPVQSVAGKTGAVTLVKADVGLGSVENYGLATQAEAEAGTSAVKYMTPQRTAQAIQKQISGLGGGDMLKSVYDTNNNGKIDQAEAADSVPWAGVTGKPATFTPATHQHSTADITSGILAAARLPAATTSAAGISQLNNTVTSTSTTQAATANAVKLVNDLASSKSKIVVSATAPADADIWYQEL